MARRIDTQGVTESVRLKEGAAPATPAAGYRNLYVKTTGLFLIDDAGNEYQISPDVIGTAYQFLRVNSGATGIEYVSAGRVLISEQTPTGTGTVTWSSIPATYKSLELEYVARGTQVAEATTMILYFNNDTTAGNYRRMLIQAYADTTLDAGGGDDAVIAVVAAANSPAGSCGAGHIRIIQYAGTAFNKQVLCNYSYRRDASTNKEYTGVATMEWESAAAINRVDLVLSANNYDTGSTFRLYGVF